MFTVNEYFSAFSSLAAAKARPSGISLGPRGLTMPRAGGRAAPTGNGGQVFTCKVGGGEREVKTKEKKL